MHHRSRHLLPSHTHCHFRTHIGLASHGLTRQLGTARAGYATLSSAAIDDEAGRDKEDPPRPTNPYPYPKHPNPTPYQIFHLPMSASQAQIKERYFDLVRAHHPDSHHATEIGAELAHARFRTIKASYDFLAGKTLSPHPNARPAPSPQNFDPYMHELARRRRAYYAAQGRYQTHNESGESTGYSKAQYPDDGFNESGTKERIILAFGVLSLLAGLFPTVPGTLISALFPSSITTPPNTSSRDSANDALSTNSDSASVPKSSVEESTPAAATSAGGLKLPIMDLNKGHRDAVSALVEVRSERETMGVERREGVRRRVKEMNGAAEAEAGANPPPSPSPPRSPSQSSRDTDQEPMSRSPKPLRQGISVNGVDAATTSEPTPLPTTLSPRDKITGDPLAPPTDSITTQTREPSGTSDTARSRP